MQLKDYVLLFQALLPFDGDKIYGTVAFKSGRAEGCVTGFIERISDSEVKVTWEIEKGVIMIPSFIQLPISEIISFEERYPKTLNIHKRAEEVCYFL